MTFDEQLRRAFDTLADRLRDEVNRQLDQATAALKATVEAERAAAAAQAAKDAQAGVEKDIAARLAAAESKAEQRGRDAGRKDGFDAGRQEGLAQGREQGLAQGRQEGRTQAHDEGFAKGRDEGAAKGREEGVAKGREQGLTEGRQEGLRQGLEKGREESRTNARAAELAANERLVEAVRSIDRARSLSEILDTLASCAGREAARVGVLLVRGGQLRGWRFLGFPPALDDAGRIEVALGDAGIIGEAVRSVGTVATSKTSNLLAPSFAELPPGRESVAVPVPMSGEVVAVLYADQNRSDSPDREPRAGWPATLEIMARHAARCLEALTAFKAAQALTDRSGHSSAEPNPGPARSSSASDSEEEDQAAKRYARLLVSEIKLYHEAAVIAGRRERDLATRLGGEIARARVLYEQRVPAHVRRAADHFHAELVRTLADGDPSLLQVKA